MKEQRAGRRRRVFLVDRHALMRRAAADWINRCSTLEVCGTAGSVAQAFRAIRHLRPDIVVTEIPRRHDLGFIREFRCENPHLKVLVFTAKEEEFFQKQAREAGANGFLKKRAGGEALLRKIRAALSERGGSDFGM